jgi:hypothetical protein
MRVFRLSLVLLGGILAAPSIEAATTSDVFNIQGEYDRFAVGNAHRWYDKHTAEAKQKSGHCLSILDEAKAIQETALALDEEARRPGIDSSQATALRKQANEQFGLRDKKIRAFIECFNQANRRHSPSSDQFTSGEDATPTDQVRTHPIPSPHPNTRGGKSIKRTPEQPPASPRDAPQPVALDKAVDDCFSKFVPNYSSPNWTLFSKDELELQATGQLQQSFDVSAVAAERAIYLDEAIHGAWRDRELVHDYLVGWLTHCLTDQHVLPRQDPRIPYRRFMESQSPDDELSRKRITRRFEEFGFGYRSYPLPPFWDHDLAGPPSPTP